MAKPATTQNQDSFIKTVIRYFSDQRTKYGIGITLLALTAYLALSFISFFFTGAADDSIINSLVESDKGGITNWTGPTGAYISNFFINRCFGVASFSFLFLTFIIAFRFMRVKLVMIWKAFVFTTVLLVWLSVSISYFFYGFYADSFIQWGGEHGYVISKWIYGNIGQVGTPLLIIASFIVFAIFTYKGTIPFLQKMAEAIANKFKLLFTKKEKPEVIEEEETETSISDEPESTIPATEITNEKIEEPKEEYENQN
jgi:S-DNA-T family DNA segregation ATPase FtsK/SpoIIIE